MVLLGNRDGVSDFTPQRDSGTKNDLPVYNIVSRSISHHILSFWTEFEYRFVKELVTAPIVFKLEITRVSKSQSPIDWGTVGVCSACIID